MPARFRTSYEDCIERPIDSREMFFDDEAEAIAWYGDDILNPDPEVRTVALRAIGDIEGHLLDCYTFAGVDADGVEWLYQTPDGQRISVHHDSGLWTVVLLAPGDLGYAPWVRVNDFGIMTFEIPRGGCGGHAGVKTEGRHGPPSGPRPTV